MLLRLGDWQCASAVAGALAALDPGDSRAAAVLQALQHADGCAILLHPCPGIWLCECPGSE